MTTEVISSAFAGALTASVISPLPLTVITPSDTRTVTSADVLTVRKSAQAINVISGSNTASNLERFIF